MASDLTVCPGFIGLTAIHSMAYGVPVITNRRSSEEAPEVESIVPGRTGDLFEDGDLEDLVGVMQVWLRRRADRPVIRAACIDMVERHWSPDSQLRAIERAVMGLPAVDGDYP
jgi:glycosyltransferase involved in cell wall biosynthesis